jgi:hypothetical protein
MSEHFSDADRPYDEENTRLTNPRLLSASLRDTAVAGDIEYDGKAAYITTAAGNRGILGGAHYVTLTADGAGTDVDTAQAVFGASTITLPAATTYAMEGVYHIHTAGTTSHQLGLLFAGTATLTSIGYSACATNAATEVLGALSCIWVAVATVTNVSPATATATHHTILINGTVRTNAAGTFIPQYKWSAAPGAVTAILANSWLRLTPLGSNTVAAVGNWA